MRNQRRTLNIAPRGTQAASEVVSRLQKLLEELDGLPIPTGSAGTALLESLDLILEIREKVRQRAKEVLLEDSTAIPGWRVQESRPARELVHDPQAIFDALLVTFPQLSFEEFLTACKTSFAAITKLVTTRLPGEDPRVLARKIDNALASQTTVKSVERVIKLVRAKVP